MTTDQASTLLQQLGGNKFLAMTGTKNFLRGEISESNPTAWLRMDLAKNIGGVNRLKITLDANDTYTMYFYRMEIRMKPELKTIISKEQTTEGVYGDMLQSIFTKVTGLRTHL